MYVKLLSPSLMYVAPRWRRRLWNPSDRVAWMDEEWSTKGGEETCQKWVLFSAIGCNKMDSPWSLSFSLRWLSQCQDKWEQTSVREAWKNKEQADPSCSTLLLFLFVPLFLSRYPKLNPSLQPRPRGWSNSVLVSFSSRFPLSSVGSRRPSFDYHCSFVWKESYLGTVAANWDEDNSTSARFGRSRILVSLFLTSAVGERMGDVGPFRADADAEERYRKQKNRLFSSLTLWITSQIKVLGNQSNPSVHSNERLFSSALLWSVPLYAHPRKNIQKEHI